jgi:hypothetical protein
MWPPTTRTDTARVHSGIIERQRACFPRGEVAERSIAAVLKTADLAVPGFESLPLRHRSECEMAIFGPKSGLFSQKPVAIAGSNRRTRPNDAERNAAVPVPKAVLLHAAHRRASRGGASSSSWASDCQAERRVAQPTVLSARPRETALLSAAEGPLSLWVLPLGVLLGEMYGAAT